MKQSDAKRQAAYRRRMRERGYVMMRDWVHADDLQWIRDQIITRNAWRDACGVDCNASQNGSTINQS